MQTRAVPIAVNPRDAVSRLLKEKIKGDMASTASSSELLASCVEVLASNIEPMTAPSGELTASSVVTAPSSVELAASNTELTASNFEKTDASEITTVAIFNSWVTFIYILI